MTERLASHVLVGALMRRAQDNAGFATILHRGDPTSGAIMVQALERGAFAGLWERIPDFEGGYRMNACGPSVDAPSEEIGAYIERRLRSDRDLWIVELDIAGAERFAAETIC